LEKEGTHNKVLPLTAFPMRFKDDLVSSLDFLKYMNDDLYYYEKDNEIWSISGYTFNLNIPKDYKSDIYLF
jgi:hypothetical protein